MHCVLTAAAVLIAVFFTVLLIRTFIFSVKKRKTGKKQIFRAEKNMFYAERLAEMIKCRTVSVRGSFDETEFAKHRDVLKKLFPLIHENGELHIFGDDCYAYKINGKNTDRNVMLMSHHDVVAASGEWKYPPFSGAIAEDRVWGRGTVDTKTTLFAEFTAVEEMLEENITPPVNIWIVSSHNEELLGDGIYSAVDYFKKNNIVFETAIDEGGAVVELKIGKKAYKLAMIATHEKGRYALELKTDLPPTDKKIKKLNPTSRMCTFINDTINDGKLFKKSICPKLQLMLETIGAYMPFPLRLITSNIKVFSPVLKFAAPKIESMAGEFFGTTCRFDGINGGKYDGKITKSCNAIVTFRIMNNDDFEKDLKAFKKKAEKYGISATEIPELCEYREPANTDCKEYKLVENAVKKVFPDAITAEYINPAFTDARAVMDICEKTYRFIPVALNEQQFNSIHNKNENVFIDAIGNAVEFYAEFLRSYI